jgi:hypothetical protein
MKNSELNLDLLFKNIIVGIIADETIPFNPLQVFEPSEFTVESDNDLFVELKSKIGFLQLTFGDINQIIQIVNKYFYVSIENCLIYTTGIRLRFNGVKVETYEQFYS